MQGNIIDVEDEWIGVRVVDRENVEHKIAVQFDGEIQGHGQSGYPDKAAERTEEDNERVNQARRFARYYVYAERSYDTVPPAEHPVRIDAVRTAISEMDLDEFETLFGDLYEQLQYETGNRNTPTIDLPPESTNPSIFSKNIYLGVDPIETDLGETLATEHGIDLDQSAADIDLSELSEAKIEQWGEFTGEFTARSIGEETDLSEAVYLDHVSDLYVQYPDGPNIVAADDHLDEQPREPDTVIELLPIDPRSLERFKSFLDHYLKCQIRDSFVEMGIHPPESFRVIGMGRFMSTWRYDNIEFYPAFHDPNSEAFAKSH